MSAVLQRATLRTSRLLDFATEQSLVTQVGHPVPEWPLVIGKELIDNALDAAEESGVAPVIEVAVDACSITIADNGPGIPDDVIKDILDFSIRVSSREAYVSPTRGRQGNALKTLIAMPLKGILDAIGLARTHLSELALNGRSIDAEAVRQLLAAMQRGRDVITAMSKCALNSHYGVLRIGARPETENAALAVGRRSVELATAATSSSCRDASACRPSRPVSTFHPEAARRGR